MNILDTHLNNPKEYGRCFSIRDYQMKADWVFGKGVYSIEKLEPYRGRDTKIKLTCPTHKVEYVSTLKAMFTTTSCLECVQNNRKLSAAEWQAKVDLVHGEGVYRLNLLEVLRNRGRETRVEVICPIHQTTHQTSIRSVIELDNAACPRCFNEKLRANRQSKIPDLHDRLMVNDPTQIYHLDHQPNNIHKKIKITCPIHNITYRRSISNALRPTNKGCVECYNEHKRSLYAHTPEELISQMKEVHGGDYEYQFPTDYTNSKDKITAICPDHGSFEVSVSNHLHKKSRCPTCARSRPPDNQNLTETEKIRPFKLYHILIEKDGLIYEKIGITGRTVETRFNRELREGYKITTLAELNTTRYDAMCREFDILNALEQRDLRYRVVGEMRDFCGWTECFPCGSFDPSPWFQLSKSDPNTNRSSSSSV